MARWIAFDQETTSLLRSALARGTRIETLRRGPVDYALARPGAVVAVLPGSGSGSASIAVFRRSKPVAAQPVAAQSQRKISALPERGNHATSRAGGFLGLSDEIAEDTPQEKKGWWRKFWDE
ncbi:MAG TPA: hypothetical protein VGK22_17555 [Candidatus Angelobacter sp.]|jgi:hypothetical protein